MRLDPRLRINDVEAALAAVLAGQGIGRALSYQVADDLAAGRLGSSASRLRAAPPAGPVADRRRRGSCRRLVRAFLDFAAPRLERLAVLREA
ncbi:LysR substrate-binding domain-containing protein [Caulobacter segnis]